MVALALLVAAAGTFYVAPWAPLYVPALLVTFGLALWRPVHALALVPAFLPFFMAPKHIGPLRPAPQEVFLAVATVALAARCLTTPAFRPRWKRLSGSPYFLPAILFLVAATMSAVAAADRHLAFRALYQVILEPVLFASLLRLFVRRPADCWILILVVVASGTFVSAIGIGQLITGQNLSLGSGADILRVKALYGSPDNLGLLLDRVIPLWLAIVLFATLRRSVRVIWMLVGPVLLVALTYTFSRGAWIAVGMVCLLLLALRPGWTRVLAVALVITAGAIGVARAPSVLRALQAGHANTGSIRIDIWRSSIAMVRDRPLLGVGPDNFRLYYAPRQGRDASKGEQPYTQDNCWGRGYIIEPDASNEPCLSHPHNEVLDFWLSTGILGLAAAIWLLVAFGRTALRAWRVPAMPSGRALVLGAVAGMLASLIHGLVDNVYFLMDLSILFWLLLSVIDRVAGDASAGRVEGTA